MELHELFESARAAFANLQSQGKRRNYPKALTEPQEPPFLPNYAV